MSDAKQEITAEELFKQINGAYAFIYNSVVALTKAHAAPGASPAAATIADRVHFAQHYLRLSNFCMNEAVQVIEQASPENAEKLAKAATQAPAEPGKQSPPELVVLEGGAK